MTEANSNLLLFQVGPVPCCVDSNSVEMVIEPPSHITAIPGSNAFRPGLMVYAKRAVSVYDVRTKFNLSTEQRGKVIITEMGSQLFGFWVDSIQAVMLSNEGKWQILPAECPKELFESLFVLESQLIFKTNFEALAKAQVNTQAQRFIKKLLDKKDQQEHDKTKQEKINSNTIKPSIDSATKALSTDAKRRTTDTLDSHKSDNPSKTVTTSSHTETENIEPNKDKTISPVTKHIVKEPAQANVSQSKIPVESGFNKPNTNLNKPAFSSNNNNPIETPSTQPHKTKNKPVSSNLTPTHETKSKPEFTNNSISSNKTPTQAIIRKTHSKQEHFQSNKDSSQQINKEHSEDSSALSAVLISLIIISLIVAGGWYLISDTELSITKENKINITPNLTINEPVDYFETLNEYKQTIQSEKTFEVESKTIETSESELIETTKPVVTSNEGTTHPLTTEKDEETSKISQDDNTIIITINDENGEFNEESVLADKEIRETPINETVSKTEAKKLETSPEPISNSNDSIDKANNKESSIEIKIDNKPDTNKLPKTINTVTTNRIVHIIIKGDTLWHIAKRYVHNPYKYPQLAKLSRIKNPDLIYPGNKVIIIIKKNKTKTP